MKRDRSKLAYLLAALLLLALFGQAAFSSIRMSLTTDEPMHIAMGYTSLALGDYRLLPAHIHPPLVNMWAAWPLLLRPDRPDPRDVPGWKEGNLFKFSAQLVYRLGPIEAVEFATRVPIMLLALLLGALVYRWASDLAGARAGLLALFLYAFDPGIISGAQFNTTDMGAAAFGALALWAAQRSMRHSRLTVLAGLALGASIAAKVSGLFFGAMITALIGMTTLVRWRNGKRREVLQLAKQLALIGALALGVLWAAYRFELKPLPGLGLPIPATSHWLVLQAFNEHVAQGHMAFLNGQVGQYGWWWYFALAFVVKTPLPVLLLLAGATISLIFRRRITRLQAAWLLAPPLAYFISALFSTIDIGYRHLLPVLPFLFVFIGVQGESGKWKVESGKPKATRLLSVTFYLLLFAWHLANAARAFPHYLPYFNELAGGTDNGWRYLADSNTDWGQALKELAACQQAEGIDRINLSLFTFIDPAIYGIRYTPLTPLRGDTPAVFPSRFNPPPGDYVISATTLDGIPLADPEMFDWFRRREPDAVIGHVMFLYRVKDTQPRAWVAQCASPVAPLEPEQIAQGFGQSNLRLVYFDCASSWLYPTGGQAPGWFVLPGSAPAHVQHYLGETSPSYEQKRAGFSPPFRVYENNRQMRLPGGNSARVAPSSAPPGEASNTSALDPPIAFEGGLTLLGYGFDRPLSQLKPGETIYLETAWRIDTAPVRLLSLMAHVLDADGRAVAVGDGLGVPLENWQPGDVFIQRHTLTLPSDTPPGAYWVQTGVYWLDNGQRWAVQYPRAAGDRVLLVKLEIR